MRPIYRQRDLRGIYYSGALAVESVQRNKSRTDKQRPEVTGKNFKKKKPKRNYPRISPFCTLPYQGSRKCTVASESMNFLKCRMLKEEPGLPDSLAAWLLSLLVQNTDLYWF